MFPVAKIQVLPKHLADMIAAGEVVERPASVVKELVENAIDAQADQITVEIRHGGATYIRVTDNGVGIPKEEVPTAFLRHATSKLQTAQDLDRIGTLGFRGEALAAISAVSHVQIMTKPADQPMGYSYAIENSQPQEAGDAGCPDGTTIVVRDVFFSVPARYKYLKADAAEAAAIHAIVERQALARPEISFRFLKDGKSVFTTAGDGVLLHVIDTLMPGQSQGLLEVTAAEGPITVTGYVGRPTQCRGTRAGQHTFVNGRWVKSKLLTAAIERAYENQRMVGRFPVAVLHIGLPLDQVDVNAHPAKTEVRFVEEKALFGRVYHAVEGALAGAADRPALRTEPAAPVSPTSHASPPPSAILGERADRQMVFQSPAAAPAPAVPRARPALWPAQEESWRAPAQGSARSPEAERSPEPEPKAEADPVQTRFPFPPTARYDPAPPPAETETAAADDLPAGADVPLETAPEAAPWRIVGEAMKTYIIVEQGDRLLFIDKHAAHERLGFDALKAQGYRPMAQELLKPLVWRPAPEDRAVLLERAGELEAFGFQLEDFGADSIVVRAAPDFLAYEDISAALEELARQYALGSADPDAQRDQLMHTMACKAAMKGGQTNQAQELEVIARAVMEGRVTHCPHGRPVATELTRKQLEKQFGRA